MLGITFGYGGLMIVKYQIFKAVTQSKNITRAANSLNLTQAAVSKAIKSLEQEFGFELFKREKYGVALTEAGEHILVHVNSVLSANRKLENLINDYNHLKKGKLVIGSFSSASTGVLPDLIKSYSEKYPNIQIIIKEGHYDEIQDWLDRNVVDIGLLTKEFVKDKYEKKHLFTDHIKLIVPKAFELERKKASIKLIETYPFIVTEHYPNPFLLNLLNSFDLKPDIKFVVKTNQTVFAFVECGLGVALLPESSLLRTNFIFDIIDLEEIIPRHIFMVTKSENLQTPMVSAFWKLIQSDGYNDI